MATIPLAKDPLLEYITANSPNMTDEQKRWPVVAMLAGPSVVVEVIVRNASLNSGHEMVWGYVGGRALVHSLGDRIECRSAIFYAFPVSDISPGEAVTLKKKGS